MSFVEKSKRELVELRRTEEGNRLFRGERPFFVKGAGGFERIDLLASCGANSVRTWGAEQTEQILPRIRETGIALCAGLWLEPARRGFDYGDAEAVRRQEEALQGQVLRLKDEACLLLWGVGNELDLGGGADENTWLAVESLARFIKAVDPFHPVMTVLASAHEPSLRLIERHCPSIDIVGINSYGDIEKVGPALAALNWTRPYLITEWGANGSWEVETTSWGAEIEPTSTEKAEQVRRRYRCMEAEGGQCLGSYVFLWGSKQETTPTWYGLLSPEGRVTEAVEAISALWRGERESGRCPRIGPLRLDGRDAAESYQVGPGALVQAAFEARRGDWGCLEVRWSLRRESDDKGSGGDPERESSSEPLSSEALGIGEITFRAPFDFGAYRLFVEVLGPENTLATANFPFRVR